MLEEYRKGIGTLLFFPFKIKIIQGVSSYFPRNTVLHFTGHNQGLFFFFLLRVDLLEIKLKMKPWSGLETKQSHHSMFIYWVPYDKWPRVFLAVLASGQHEVWPPASRARWAGAAGVWAHISGLEDLNRELYFWVKEVKSAQKLLGSELRLVSQRK